MTADKVLRIVSLSILFLRPPSAFPGTGREMRFIATATALHGKTAMGTPTHAGIVAADPAILPLGSRIRVSHAGAYSGTYIVQDTGTKITGRKIDLFLHSRREAGHFGRKTVVVRVLR